MDTALSLKKVSSSFGQYRRCAGNKDAEERPKHLLAEQFALLPNGSGLDRGVAFDWAKSTPNKLIFLTHFHHMTEGHYDGWTSHRIIVTPSFAFGYDIKVTGQNKNDIKEYLYELFSTYFEV